MVNDEVKPGGEIKQMLNREEARVANARQQGPSNIQLSHPIFTFKKHYSQRLKTLVKQTPNLKSEPIFIFHIRVYLFRKN
jgi:cobalamin biosynthesis Co2+ chelatase CbiK